METTVCQKRTLPYESGLLKMIAGNLVISGRAPHYGELWRSQEFSILHASIWIRTTAATHTATLWTCDPSSTQPSDQCQSYRHPRLQFFRRSPTDGGYEQTTSQSLWNAGNARKRTHHGIVSISATLVRTIHLPYP